jgi:hypothetical protein
MILISIPQHKLETRPPGKTQPSRSEEFLATMVRLVADSSFLAVGIVQVGGFNRGN